MPSESAKTSTVVFSEDVLGSMACPVLVVSGGGHICYVNPAGEQLFGASSSALTRSSLTDFLSKDSPLLAMLEQVGKRGSSAAEYGIRLAAPRLTERLVDVHASPCQEDSSLLVLTFHARSLAQRLGGHRLGQMGAARSATGFAETLTHEIRNPLSGIRGAAQLLAEVVEPSDKELTRLICEETDRIGALLSRFDSFADGAPSMSESVNIHAVLNRVSLLASNGFAKGVQLVHDYDPSLPPVAGDRDRLVQAFLNLVKNAAEASPKGEIRLSTGFSHGLRVRTPGASGRSLPIYVAVEDDGPGVPADIRGHIFEPFVSTKAGDRGLGLSLVARIVEDHGGIVEVEDTDRGTCFTVHFPASQLADEAVPFEEDAA